MNNIGKPERVTQNRVVKLFCEELDYKHANIKRLDFLGLSTLEAGKMQGLAVEWVPWICP